MSHLHIVTFDIPYPASYGGVIDVFYKIKALHEIGVKIQLHCYEYGREHSIKLEKYCATVHYYKRDKSPRYLFDLKPYIVNTRSDKKLLNNLLKDDFPILFEGLHSTYLLKHSSLKDRLKLVRTHNIEHEYYWHLFKAEKTIYKKIFFAIEALKLKNHERVLNYANEILAITKSDCSYLQRYGSSTFIPAFHINTKLPKSQGKGYGILYHGNLAVSENRKAALFLIENVFNRIDLPVIIAGKKASSKIRKKAAKLKHVELISNPSEDEMLDYISNAKINILITFQSTGIKLKLLNALVIGRHCIVNSEMIEKTGLADLCTIANSPDEMVSAINKLYEMPYTDSEDQKRQEVMQDLYSNRKSALKILEIINKT